MRHTRTTTFGMVALFFVTSSCLADAMSDLKSRFENRLPALRQLKDAGKVGETTAGMVEAVQKDLDDAGAGLVQSENADRSALYDLIAKKEGTTVPVVAERNAVRNFRNAKAGDFLKGRDGAWKQK